MDPLLLSLIIFVVFTFFILLFFFIILPLFVGAPFDPTHKRELKKIVEFSRIKKGDRVVDLGSGNGRVVIEFAKLKDVKEVHGFEINPFLVWISRRKIKELGLEEKAFVHWRNFWNVNLNVYDFDIVTIFQLSFIMEKLEKKFKKELKPKTKVISNTWKFPNWKPKNKEGKVYLYEV
jgi:SAM-dependent methyltransferase